MLSTTRLMRYCGLWQSVQHWRAVVRGTLACWNALRLDDVTPSGKIDFWHKMGRGGLQALALASDHGALAALTSVQHQNNYFRCLTKLEFSVSPRSHSTITFDYFYFPTLEDVRVNLNNRLHASLIFNCCPKLRHIELNVREFVWDPIHMPKHLHTLAVVASYLSVLSMPKLLADLRAVPVLTSLVLHVTRIFPGGQAAVNIHGMSELCTLADCSLSSCVAYNILPSFLFPTLEHLTLQQMLVSDVPLRLQGLPNLASITIRLHGTERYLNLLCSLLRHAERLAQLTLDGAQRDDVNTLLKRLAADPRLAPALARLDLSRCLLLRSYSIELLVHARPGKIRHLRVHQCQRVEAKALWPVFATVPVVDLVP